LGHRNSRSTITLWLAHATLLALEQISHISAALAAINR
jgi:hypothetical protein